MIQLKVYEDKDKLRSAQYFLDLYETEPIKLTLSIEDITSADATSTYSKAFKVPGTRKNAEFFKNSFDVDGILYDVTTKKPAEVLVDGTEFKQGHVRLQKVFWNQELDRYDYELLFLGETRDFSSAIGDRGLCELDLSDLIGDDAGNTLTADDVIQSWEAYPQNASLTAGLHDGDIIYPLIDHGNTYDDDDGSVNETRIAVNQEGSSPHFTKSGDPLTINRMKPMIRAKKILDKIFEIAGYTYTSEFFNSDLFHQIYISAFGNEATIGYENTVGGGTNSKNIAYGENLTDSQGVTFGTYPNPNDGLNISDNQVDAGNNLSNYVYAIPVDGVYSMEASCYYIGHIENSDYGVTNIRSELYIWNYSTNTLVSNSPLGYGQTLQTSITFDTTSNPNINPGDQIGIYVYPSTNYLDFDLVNDVRFAVTSAPGDYNPGTGLECSYKQIDYIKDLLTAFRLVLAPDSKDPKNFIIEPWQTYINSGDLYDWSSKLVQNKDVTIEPVFFSQSDQIKFDMQEGGDYTNIYHKQAYSENYGYLEFNSGNELLKGTRNVKLTGIAPTPIAQIEGSSEAEGDNVVIPQLHTHSAEDVGLEHLPIKAKTRMLFYNGLQSFIHPNNQGGPSNLWYLQGATTPARSTYPMVSPYQEWPIAPQTLNLNWFNDIQYWGIRAGYNEVGSTLYGDYWSRYIASLYNKYSRRVTAYFVLNNIDLNEFSFDDTIFVNGTYYRPEKIIDVEVGAYTEVKVQMLTANDYRPKVFLDQELTGFSLTADGGGCGIAIQPSITVTTNGSPPFTWQLANGSTGVALQNAQVGQAPYTFDIQPVNSGPTVVTVTDNFGRSTFDNITVPQPSVSYPVATFTQTDPTVCQPTQGAPCNGSISITPSGGIPPYTIDWQQNVTGFNPTDLCPGTYDFTIFDANGCQSPFYNTTLECETPVGTVHHWVNVFYDEQCFGALGTKNRYTLDQVSYGPGTVAKLTNQQGCWFMQDYTQAPIDATVLSVGEDCISCGGGPQPEVDCYIIEDCQNLDLWTIPQGNSNFNVGDVVQWTNIGGGTIYCGTITALVVGTPDAELYNDTTSYFCGDSIHCQT